MRVRRGHVAISCVLGWLCGRAAAVPPVTLVPDVVPATDTESPAERSQPPGRPRADDIAKKPLRVWHVRLATDLDRMHLVEDFTAHVAQAKKQRYDRVVLELRGRRARLDVCEKLAEAVRGAELPVAVFLAGGTPAGDEDETPRGEGSRDGVRRGNVANAHTNQFGFGVWTIALAAPAHAVAEGAVFVSEASDDPRELAPAGTQFEPLEAAVLDRLRPRLERHGLPAELIAILRAPAGESWLCPASGDSPARVAVVDSPGCERVVFKEAGRTIARVDARRLAELGLIDGVAASLDAFVRTFSNKKPTRILREISGTLEDQRASAEAGLDAARESLEAAKKVMEIDEDATTTSDAACREAGRKGLDRLAEARESIEGVERLIERVPEVLRLAAPGQTTAGTKASAFAARWRTIIQSRRDSMEKLKVRAEDLAGR